MQSSMWGILLILLGVIGIALALVFGNVLVSSEQDYFLLKEITEAAMVDAIDELAFRVGVGWDGVSQNCYRKNPNAACELYDNNGIEVNTYMHCVSGKPGTIRIIREKFVESFTMRFAESVSGSKNYTLYFYDIDECPPKVTVVIGVDEDYGWLRKTFGATKSETVETAEITTYLSAILETRSKQWLQSAGID